MIRWNCLKTQNKLQKGRRATEEQSGVKRRYIFWNQGIKQNLITGADTRDDGRGVRGIKTMRIMGGWMRMWFYCLGVKEVSQNPGGVRGAAKNESAADSEVGNLVAE